jgi:hypothetical protein
MIFLRFCMGLFIVLGACYDLKSLPIYAFPWCALMFVIGLGNCVYAWKQALK